MTELEIRAKATSATFEKFNQQPLVLGKTDCARMVAFHLKQLGYKFSLLRGGHYSTEVGARMALKKMGVSSLSEIMDKHFTRIPFLEARTGDVSCVPGEGNMGDAMQVVLHRQNVIGFHPDGFCGELTVIEPAHAWRVV